MKGQRRELRAALDSAIPQLDVVRTGLAEIKEAINMLLHQDLGLVSPTTRVGP